MGNLEGKCYSFKFINTFLYTLTFLIHLLHIINSALCNLFIELWKVGILQKPQWNQPRILHKGRVGRKQMSMRGHQWAWLSLTSEGCWWHTFLHSESCVQQAGLDPLLGPKLSRDRRLPTSVLAQSDGKRQQMEVEKNGEKGGWKESMTKLRRQTDGTSETSEWTAPLFLLFTYKHGRHAGGNMGQFG